MKILQDKFLIFSIAWMAVFYLLAFALAKFYLFPLGLVFMAVYEAIRTEGKKNTKPVSILFLIVLIFQFAHTTKIFPFPFDLRFLLDILPIKFPAETDPFLFISILVLLFFSITLIKYTWGSVTKFLAILLLIGSILQGFVFWPEIKSISETPEGQEMIDESTEKIKDNLRYRIMRELE